MTSSKVSIFHFTDFADFLVAYIADRQLQQPWFSLRWLTRRAKLGSPAQLSILVNRQRPPSVQLVERICEALCLSDDESRYAVLIAERELNRSTILRKVIAEELDRILARQ